MKGGGHMMMNMMVMVALQCGMGFGGKEVYRGAKSAGYCGDGCTFQRAHGFTPKVGALKPSKVRRKRARRR